MPSLRTRVAAGVLGTGLLLGGGLTATALAHDDEAEHEERRAQIEERIAQAESDGRIDADQADALRSRFENRLARHEERSANRAERSQDLADTLGLSVDELRAALQDGSTLADLAEAAGLDLEAFIDDLVAEAEARIDEAVANERIDADKAEELKANVRDRIEARVNGERPERPERGDGERRRGFGPRGFGHRGGAPDAGGD